MLDVGTAERNRRKNGSTPFKRVASRLRLPLVHADSSRPSSRLRLSTPTNTPARMLPSLLPFLLSLTLLGPASHVVAKSKAKQEEVILTAEAVSASSQDEHALVCVASSS